jgi:hypothetical protein
MQEPSLWAAILERLRRLDAAWARREAWRAAVARREPADPLNEREPSSQADVEAQVAPANEEDR